MYDSKWKKFVSVAYFPRFPEPFSLHYNRFLSWEYEIYTRCSSSSFIVTLSLIRRTACARAQFGGCSSATNGHSETRQMAVCCQNLPLGALSSRSALPVPVGALFKKFGLFLNTPCIPKLEYTFPLYYKRNWEGKWNWCNILDMLPLFLHSQHIARMQHSTCKQVFVEWHVDWKLYVGSLQTYSLTCFPPNQVSGNYV